jgi:hypothetical protein
MNVWLMGLKKAGKGQVVDQGPQDAADDDENEGLGLVALAAKGKQGSQLRAIKPAWDFCTIS